MNTCIIEIETRKNNRMFSHIAAIFSRRQAEIESYIKKDMGNCFRITIHSQSQKQCANAIKDLEAHNDILSLKSDML